MEASGSGSGIKGCLAREAYVKVVADLDKLGEVVQKNASEELGLDPLQPHPGLIRDYIEKRTPPGRSPAPRSDGLPPSSRLGSRVPDREPTAAGILLQKPPVRGLDRECRRENSWLLTSHRSQTTP